MKCLRWIRQEKSERQNILVMHKSDEQAKDQIPFFEVN